MSKKRIYTEEEFRMAVGTEIEYDIPPQAWPNYIKPGYRSSGKLIEVSPEINGLINVYDIKLNERITVYCHNTIKIPFIDAIRTTKLYRLLHE
jgi:hypothetical protein